MEAPAGGGWAWHPAEQLPQVLAWLDGGSDAERALAEDIYEAFQPALLELQVDLPSRVSPSFSSHAPC